MDNTLYKHLSSLIVLVIFLAQVVNAAGPATVNNTTTTVEGQPQGGFQGSSGWNSTSNSTPASTPSIGESTILGVNLQTFVVAAIIVILAAVLYYYFKVMKK